MSEIRSRVVRGAKFLAFKYDLNWPRRVFLDDLLAGKDVLDQMFLQWHRYEIYDWLGITEAEARDYGFEWSEADTEAYINAWAQVVRAYQSHTAKRVVAY